MFLENSETKQYIYLNNNDNIKLILETYKWTDFENISFVNKPKMTYTCINQNSNLITEYYVDELQTRVTDTFNFSDCSDKSSKNYEDEYYITSSYKDFLNFVLDFIFQVWRESSYVNVTIIKQPLMFYLYHTCVKQTIIISFNGDTNEDHVKNHDTIIKMIEFLLEYFKIKHIII